MPHPSLSLLYDTSFTSTGLDVANPANGEILARVRTYDRADLVSMIERADVARRAWQSRTAKERAHILRDWAELIEAQRDGLATIITLECGKPLVEAHREVSSAAAYIEWFAEEGRRAYGELIPGLGTDRRVVTLREPVGTCAAITPWNFPLAMIARKAAPALAAGCSMVVKPAEATPMSAMALERLAHESGIPHDLFRVAPVLDPVEAGSLFCNHPLVRKISFTGSTRVGKLLMAQAAGQVKRLSLELGGNAPFVVFDDADLDRAIDGAIASRFRNAGQTCICANRFLVQASVHDAFVDGLARRVAQLRMGDGMTPGVNVGPLIDAAAVARVSDLVTTALAGGARLVAGGSAVGNNFYEPSILRDVKPDMRVAQEEIFGPVAAIIRFAEETDALRLANDTPYGLAAYLYTGNNARLWRMMESLEFGMIAVNEGLLSSEEAPFGGIKESGFGREGSRHGLADYMTIKYGLIGGLAA